MTDAAPDSGIEHWIAKAQALGLGAVAGLDDFRGKLGVPEVVTSAHHERGRISKRAARDHNRRVLAEIAAIETAQESSREAFEQMLAAGTIRLTSRRERLERAAAGHPDNPSTQAARRILARMENADGTHEEG